MTDDNKLAALYYSLGRPAAFSTADKLYRASKESQGHAPTRAAVNKFLEFQESHTLHRPVRRKFPRNPYSPDNILDIWQSDLLDLHAYARDNDNYRYVLSVIDVFSKYLHLVPLKAKTGPAVAEAFGSILKDPRYTEPYVRRPVVVQTDKGKEFLNRPFQDLMRREGIEHRTCRNPDVKCAVVERVHRTIRDRLQKYFTRRNTHRYIDVLQKFVRAYNDTIHRTTDRAPSEVNDSNVLEIWEKMNRDNIKRVRVVKPKYRVNQHVRISKEKMRFAKASESNFSTEIFRISKVISGRPRPLYELHDLNDTPIDGQFYQEELVPVRISKQTVYKIDKIMGRRTRKGIREVLVSWKGYPPSFNSWIRASSVKNI
jgi:hypothetical protein